MSNQEINKSSREYVTMRQKQYLEQISETDPTVGSCIDYYENEGNRLSIEVTMPNKDKYPGFLDAHMGPENLAAIVGTEAGGLPVTNPNTIHPGMPPMLIIHGEEDAVIPIGSIRQYVKRAEDNGVNVTLSIYPGAEHGFFNYNKDRAHFYMGIGEMLLFMKVIGG